MDVRVWVRIACGGQTDKYCTRWGWVVTDFLNFDKYWGRLLFKHISSGIQIFSPYILLAHNNAGVVSADVSDNWG